SAPGAADVASADGAGTDGLSSISRAQAMIHPTAKIDPQVELAEGVEVEEYAVIRGKVCIGAGTVIRPYTMICGTTRIGARCRIGPCAFIGMDPQHRGYAGAETLLVVG